MKPNNPPDFPGKREGVNNESSIVFNEGITLRDYIAVHVLSGLCHRQVVQEDLIEMLSKEVIIKQLAVDSYGIADAMLKERERYDANK